MSRKSIEQNPVPAKKVKPRKIRKNSVTSLEKQGLMKTVVGVKTSKLVDINKLKELNIIINCNLISFIKKYKLESIVYDILKQSRKIFGNERELVLQSDPEINSYLNLIVRQKNYPEDDPTLNNLIYELIQFTSKKFLNIKTQARITIDTDYNEQGYEYNRIKP